MKYQYVILQPGILVPDEVPSHTASAVLLQNVFGISLSFIDLISNNCYYQHEHLKTKNHKDISSISKYVSARVA